MKNISKLIFELFLICTWGVVVYSQGIRGGDSLPCIKKLLACQPYLKHPSSPPASCCVPLNQIIVDERQCLCSMFHDPAILKAFNVTKDDGINLAKSCGANVDINMCKTAAAPAGSPSSPDTPSSTNNSEPAAPPKRGGTARHGDMRGCRLGVASILTIILWAF